MMYAINLENLTPEAKEDLFFQTIAGYLDSKLPQVTNLANFSAIIKAFYPDLNWTGFYLYDGVKLSLGPFQGLPACTEIAMGKGVCGKSAESLTSIIVPDTGNFMGHIVCDPHSRSELVVPIIVKQALFGVLDLDSPDLNHFQEADRLRFEKAVNLLIDIL